jgi:catechol 2,3-dioxygenase-like lactoylglutathione lyase family enzyme
MVAAAPGQLVNLDVPDIEAGIAFHTSALGLSVGLRFDGPFGHGFHLVQFSKRGL